MNGSKMSWFAFFPGDWLSNRDVKRMSLDQRGAYIQLLCWQWQGEGYLDGTDQDIAALGDMIGREWTDERVAQVLQKFPRAADGRRANTKLLNIWQEAARIHSARRRSAENTNANRYGHRPCAASVTESVTDTVTESVGDPSPSPPPPPHPPPKEEKDSSEPAHKTRLDVLRLMPLFSDAQKSSPDFMEQWKMWLDFRMTAKRKPKRPEIMFRQQIKWLQRFPITEQIEIMSASIRNDWQGLFEPRTNGNAGPKPQKPQGIDFKTYMAQAGRKEPIRSEAE